ncbi:transposase [Humibacillus xanthopallidus]|uniref:transposase n=1 Tax=Humibacillus xanthopallidus TaxID=412689 RepID=UPI00384E9E32
MAPPRKYPEELRERAIRRTVDLRRDPDTKAGAVKRVGEQFGINPDTLRNWVQQAEADQAHHPGVMPAEARRIAELEREVKELRADARPAGVLASQAAEGRRGRPETSGRLFGRALSGRS